MGAGRTNQIRAVIWNGAWRTEERSVRDRVGRKHAKTCSWLVNRLPLTEHSGWPSGPICFLPPPLPSSFKKGFRLFHMSVNSILCPPALPPQSPTPAHPRPLHERNNIYNVGWDCDATRSNTLLLVCSSTKIKYAVWEFCHCAWNIFILIFPNSFLVWSGLHALKQMLQTLTCELCKRCVWSTFWPARQRIWRGSWPAWLCSPCSSPCCSMWPVAGQWLFPVAQNPFGKKESKDQQNRVWWKGNKSLSEV